MEGTDRSRARSWRGEQRRGWRLKQNKQISLEGQRGHCEQTLDQPSPSVDPPHGISIASMCDFPSNSRAMETLKSTTGLLTESTSNAMSSSSAYIKGYAVSMLRKLRSDGVHRSDASLLLRVCSQRCPFSASSPRRRRALCRTCTSTLPRFTPGAIMPQLPSCFFIP